MQHGHRRGSSPPAILLAGLIAQVATHFFVPGTGLLDGQWTVLGVLPLGTGIVLMVLGDLQFKRAGTATSPRRWASTLVTDGVFAVSRNPMYTGMVLCLLGVAVLFGTLAPLLVPPVVGWVLSVRFIRGEEEDLRRLFGEQYDAYQRRVRRWVGVRRGGGGPVD